jgi:hypothetical protein
LSRPAALLAPPAITAACTAGYSHFCLLLSSFLCAFALAALVVSSFALFAFFYLRLPPSSLLPFVAVSMSFVRWAVGLRVCPAPLSPSEPSFSEPRKT